MKAEQAGKNKDTKQSTTAGNQMELEQRFFVLQLFNNAISTACVKQCPIQDHWE
jgi:hypothetical protein